MEPEAFSFGQLCRAGLGGRGVGHGVRGLCAAGKEGECWERKLPIALYLIFSNPPETKQASTS